MITVSFPNWSDALAAADLPDKVRQQHRIIIQWFLGYLKREQAAATQVSARQFVAHLMETRQPKDWQAEQWREGLNWFFREAPSRRRAAEKEFPRQLRTRVRHDAGRIAANEKTEGAVSAESYEDGRQHYAHTVAEMQAQVAIDPWYTETVRLMRVRHMAYRTEETYLGWIRRMERFTQAKDGLEAFGETDLKRFLSFLAVEEGVSPGTQRQALNAGVFFLREVRKMQLGDFSDYVKADPRKYYPVVYSRGEIQRLLAAMRGRGALMARLQYGCGLRVSELCRLRVKDIDLERGKLYIRASKGDKDRCVPLPRSLRRLWLAILRR